MGLVYNLGGGPKDSRKSILIPYEEPLQQGIWCADCRKSYGKDDFYKDRSQPSGMSARCKQCDNAYRSLKRRNKRYEESKTVTRKSI